MEDPTRDPTAPSVIAVTMGYGHLRAAASLADHIGVAFERADAAPLASRAERFVWSLASGGYHSLSRLSQQGVRSAVFGPMLHRLTAIPEPSDRDPQRLPGPVRFLDTLVRLGFGRGFANRRRSRPSSVLTTFYATAIAAEHHGTAPVACVVTDSHVHRVWVPRRPEESRIDYLVPVAGTADCVASYGLPSNRIHVTGFPLPDELASPGPLRRNLDSRIRRLSPGSGEPAVPITLTVAVGGAGAQADHARDLIAELGSHLAARRLRLILVAGTHARVAKRFRRWMRRARASGLPDESISVLHAASFADYYHRFNEALAETDLLWTKPSELVFYAGLGLPLVLEPPVGDHEDHNKRLVTEAGAGFSRPPAGELADWLHSGLESGRFGDAARQGRKRLPCDGTARIASYCSRELYDEFTGG